MKLKGGYEVPESINRLQSVVLGMGGVGLLVWAIGCYMDTQSALRGWLLGLIFWAGIGIGGIGILLLQYLTGGAWGVVIRRVAEACSRTIPLLAILFIPIGVGVYQLYEWANLPKTDHFIAHRGWYLEPLWWGVRAIVYFVILGIIAYLLNSWSSKQDAAENAEESAKYLGKAARFSGPTMVIFVLVVTFLSVDWMMTLEPHWFSTMWGFLFVVGWGLSCFCFSVAVLAFLSDKKPMDRILGKRHFHDIGKTHACVGDGLGVLQLLPVSDNMVR